MERIACITPPDEHAMQAARGHWNSIAKPLKSLGLLEEAVVKIAGITGSEQISIEKRCVVVWCADNGVVAQGVSQSGSEVTGLVAESMAQGDSNINHMAACFGAEVLTIDIGMQEECRQPGIRNLKIAYGTGDISKGPAMTRAQAIAGICAGIDSVRERKQKGYEILITGEMGIGNTTTASAIAAVLLGESVEAVTGRGAGLDQPGLIRKREVIAKALEINRPQKEDAIDLLARVGGYDIAGMMGMFLGGAIYHMPIVIDGFISAVAAALAVQLQPIVRDYMLCSHVSKEPAASRMLELLRQEPLIHAQMSLGEGTGGVLLLPLLDAALSVYHSPHSFQKLQMEAYQEL